jgi:hypothetical protein
MNINPLGIPAAAAGSPLAQTKGPALERAQQEVDATRRTVYHEEKADAAAGVGQPDGEDHQSDQCDGDGRRPWEDQSAPDRKAGMPRARQSKDPSQQSGNLLDLTG